MGIEFARRYQFVVSFLDDFKLVAVERQLKQSDLIARDELRGDRL